MDKRQFLVAGALGAALPVRAHAAPAIARRGPGLLTVTGAITRSNRGPFDPALDQLMVKHGAKFDTAREFDAALLASLPAVTIQPTLESDAKVHKLSGPLRGAVVRSGRRRAGGVGDAGLARDRTSRSRSVSVCARGACTRST